MNRYLKEFLHRGLIFGGFGPIILGIIYAVLQKTDKDFSLDGTEILVAIVSIYLLAFIQAGSTVFNQIESFSIPKSMFCHLSLLYVTYISCYLLNSWLPFEPKVILIFTIVFIAIYFVVWAIVVVTLKGVSKRLNKRLR